MALTWRRADPWVRAESWLVHFFRSTAIGYATLVPAPAARAVVARAGHAALIAPSAARARLVLPQAGRAALGLRAGNVALVTARSQIALHAAARATAVTSGPALSRIVQIQGG